MTANASENQRFNKEKETIISGSVNRVILVGRLGKDPEVRYTADGAAVANFSLATDESFTDRAGDKQTRTEWHRIVAWKRLAEISGEFLTKGKQVYVEGTLRTNKWQDREGSQRTSLEVVASRVVMLGSKAGGQRASNESGDSGRTTGQATTGPQIGEEEIPF
jgi:single-strand DNA-binding protein